MVASPRAADSHHSVRTSTDKYKVPPAGRAVKISSKLPLLQEKEKEQMLNTTGDICGGRGGELGRRLEAWLTVKGNGSGYEDLETKWLDDERKMVEVDIEGT
jgi:hypothetical protein